MADGKKIRTAAVAGQFYPADAGELRRLIQAELAKTKILTGAENLRAIVVPHAGYVYSASTAAWGFRQLTDQGDKQFVLLGPSHHYAFEDVVADDTDYWETPLGRVKYVPAVKSSMVQVGEVPHKAEHSLEVQLPFLQVTAGQNCRITGFLTGIQTDFERITDYFNHNYTKSIFIVSSDLSHYLTAQAASQQDMETIKAIEQLDADYFLREGNTACGRIGIAILLSMARLRQWRVQAIHYETSATATGDLNRVVGYVAVAFYDQI